MIIPITTLWLPILIGAVLAFLASFVLHMLLPLHRSDFVKLPNEDEVMEALSKHQIPPGDYVMPHGGGTEVAKTEAFQQKVQKGPVAVMTVMEPAVFTSMGSTLVQWFAYLLLVGILTAYVAGRTLEAGAEYLSIFRLTGTVSFAAYSMALMPQSIWWKKSWAATLKSMFDGLVYAALTAGAFGWLWPA